MDEEQIEGLISAAKRLARAVDRLQFSLPVTHVYNPLAYAWTPHEEYIRRFGQTPKRILFLGMNPGPFGMVQTGIPFGEVAAVRDWMKITAPVASPKTTHPKRPVLGFACLRSEVSGQRVWKLFADRFGAPEYFFRDHFVVNYCPLAFCGESGVNLTPDKLPVWERDPLFAICDRHLRSVVEALRPEWIVGVGAFAREKAEQACGGTSVCVAQILHPSPASPAANRGWSQAATRQLVEQGVWQ